VDPPIDIWAIDVFPIIWPINGNVSEAFPTTRADIVIAQVQEYRDWIDRYEAHAGKAIWVTEFGLHWGFSDWDTDREGCTTPAPAGEYQTEAVRRYMAEVYTWLEDNSDALNIERWFTFSSYRDLAVCHSDSGNGLTLFNSPAADGELTEIGEFFRDRVYGIR
jgi:hypothetical protein